VISNRRGGTTLATGIAPDPAGHPLAGTSEVALDVAVVWPELFFAVTDTRRVWI
jgi:hypothetical protein